MITNYQNEVIKRKYEKYLKEANGLVESSIRIALSALSELDEFCKGKDYGCFISTEQAIAFKEWLRGKTKSLFRWSIRKQDKDFYIEKLKSLDLGLEDKIHQKVGLLSGGQRQALTLLMATISQKPSHRTIRKDYVRFNSVDKVKAKNEVESAYKKLHEEFLAKKKEILSHKELSVKEKREQIKEAFEVFDKEFRHFDVTKPVLLLDEHTAALDPKTASKVLELTNKIVTKNNLTTIMVTHNMADAIKYGNRLIMMSKGNIVVDIQGEEKQKLTIEQLLALFSSASNNDVMSDSAILG